MELKDTTWTEIYEGHYSKPHRTVKCTKPDLGYYHIASSKLPATFPNVRYQLRGVRVQDCS